jgi:hypothetical protein
VLVKQECRRLFTRLCWCEDGPSCLLILRRGHDITSFQGTTGGCVPRLLELLLQMSWRVELRQPTLSPIRKVFCAESEARNDKNDKREYGIYASRYSFCGLVLKELVIQKSHEIQKETCWTLPNTLRLMP